VSIFLCEVSSVLALHVLFEYTAVILIIPNDEFSFYRLSGCNGMGMCCEKKIMIG